MADTPDEPNVTVEPISIGSLKRTRSEKFAVVYANNTEVGMSSWDIRLKFAQLRGGSNTPNELEDQVEVLMSLPHAKAVAIILAQYVKAYERENGPIKIPQQAQETIEADPGKSRPVKQ